jgi:hypothetical protein
MTQATYVIIVYVAFHVSAARTWIGVRKIRENIAAEVNSQESTRIVRMY